MLRPLVVLWLAASPLDARHDSTVRTFLEGRGYRAVLPQPAAPGPAYAPL
jgi:hypothetical protein